MGISASLSFFLPHSFLRHPRVPFFTWSGDIFSETEMLLFLCATTQALLFLSVEVRSFFFGGRQLSSKFWSALSEILAFFFLFERSSGFFSPGFPSPENFFFFPSPAQGGGGPLFFYA